MYLIYSYVFLYLMYLTVIYTPIKNFIKKNIPPYILSHIDRYLVV